MSRLEDLLRETFAEREAEAPDGATLLADVHRRRARRRRAEWTLAGLSAAAVASLVVSLTVVLPTHDTNRNVLRQPQALAEGKTYPLPSDGWKPGDPSLDALTGGPFHAARRDGQYCAWLGTNFRPMLWPAGYRVRLNPTELIAPDGSVVAREGEQVSAGGGGDNAKPGTPCARPGEWTFSVNGTPVVARGVVAGRLIAVGGPAPGVPRPLAGEITATGAGTTQTVQVGADGTYRLRLPPGIYTITGSSLLYMSGQGTCRTADTTVTVTAGLTTNADVLCTER